MMTPVAGQPWDVGPYAFEPGEWRTVIVTEVTRTSDGRPTSRFVADGQVYWVGHTNNRAPQDKPSDAGQLDLFGGKSADG
jgi:hypothetical protein